MVSWTGYLRGMYRIKPYKRNSVFDVMDVFDDFFRDTPRNYGNLKIDVRDLEKEYIVDVDVLGLSKEDIEVHFENERLMISINKEEENEENIKIGTNKYSFEI